MATVAVTVVATLFFGRIYCSTVCPLGYIQDIAAKCRRASRKNALRNAYRFRRPHTRLRIATLIAAIGATLAGTSVITALIDPYGAFGRIVTYIFRPLINSGGYNLSVAGFALGMAIAAATLIAVSILAARRGRLWCNTLCPVGTLLGGVSRYSLMHFDINTDRCTNCRRCEHACKSSCINLDDHTVDMSRCVVCFDCTAACRDNAITYTSNRHRLSIPMLIPVNPETAATAEASAPENASAVERPDSSAPKLSRRRFLAFSAIAAATPALAALSKATTTDALPAAPRPVAPPGAASTHGFLTRCTACGACIDVCPQKVIRPALTQWGLLHPMVPQLDFDASYCEYDCNRCSNVCPTGALKPLTLQQKQNTPIGLATVAADLCVGCGKCSRACPKEAIEMIHPEGRQRRLAIVEHARCIGCGACQHVCPVHPKAIIVNGLKK